MRAGLKPVWPSSGMMTAHSAASALLTAHLLTPIKISSARRTRRSARRSRGPVIRSGDTRAEIFGGRVTRIGDQNAGHFRYWHEAGKLDPPAMDDIGAIITQMEEAAARLDALFAGKQANLTEAVTGKEAEAALAGWDTGRAAIIATNSKIEAFLAAIKAAKASIDPAALSGLENELKVLQATKRRRINSANARDAGRRSPRRRRGFGAPWTNMAGRSPSTSGRQSMNI